MERKKRIFGYKVFNSDWTCYGGFQYEVGKTYELFGRLKCCENGFHFCMNLIDCFSYYPFSFSKRVAVVEILGIIKKERDDDYSEKCCTNKIKIVKELKWDEVLKMVNIGEGNNGIGNTGYHNNGDRNTGNLNLGSFNIGDKNCGGANIGDNNEGDDNVGSGNCGDNNSGDENIGDNNMGDQNVGSDNNGFGNLGDGNIGDGNTGNGNIGDFNLGDCNIGAFNTKFQTIMMFDKPTDWTLEDWYKSEAYAVISNMPLVQTEWINEDEMSEEEKLAHPNYSITGGYLKKAPESSRRKRQEWWDAMYWARRQLVYALPNFDPEKFQRCTGIKVSDYYKELSE